jgi:hypothetical protein
MRKRVIKSSKAARLTGMINCGSNLARYTGMISSFVYNFIIIVARIKPKTIGFYAGNIFV